MTRYLDITPDDSGRESSADPLDVISPPRSKSKPLPSPTYSSSTVPLPKKSRGRPKSVSQSLPRSDSKGRGRSYTTSREDSRSTSPFKTSGDRGKGTGRSRGRTRGSTSRSPERSVNNTIQDSDAGSGSDSESGAIVSRGGTNSRGQSNTVSRSRSTSPVKGSKAIRGIGSSRGRTRGSKSKSPVKRRTRIVSESESEDDGVKIEEGGRGETHEEEDKVDAMDEKRQMKRRRIDSVEIPYYSALKRESTVSDVHDFANVNKILQESVEALVDNQEQVITVKDEPEEGLQDQVTIEQVLENGSIREEDSVKVERVSTSRLPDTETEIMLSEDSDVDEPSLGQNVKSAEGARKEEPTNESLAVIESHQAGEDQDGSMDGEPPLTENAQAVQSPKDDSIAIHDPVQEIDLNVQESTQDEIPLNDKSEHQFNENDTIESAIAEPSNAMQVNALPIAPINAADPSVLLNEEQVSGSLVEQSGETAKEPKDLEMEDVIVEEGNVGSVTGDVNEPDKGADQNAGLDKDVSGEDMGMQVDNEHPDMENAENEVVENLAESGEQHFVKVDQPSISTGETVEEEEEQRILEVDQDQGLEAATSPQEPVSEIVVPSSNENDQDGIQQTIEEKMDIDGPAEDHRLLLEKEGENLADTGTGHIEGEIERKTSTEDNGPDVANDIRDQDADSKEDVKMEGANDIAKIHEGGVVEEEGEIELDAIEPDEAVTTQTEEDNQEKQIPTIVGTPSATPAPSSPTQSITASQTSTTKPTKKSASTSTTGKKRGPVPGSKKASAPASTGSGPSAGKKGAGKGKGKTKVEELKADSKSKSSSIIENFSIPSTPSRTTSNMNSPGPSPDKNVIYCVCRKAFNEEEDGDMMVGCESCDNWFHYDCLGLTEEMVEAFAVYICRSCERSTHQKTIYKQLCKREGCKKSLAGTSSKFCSPSCAYQHSQSLLAAMNNKNTLKQLAKTFIDYPEPKLGIQVVNHQQRNLEKKKHGPETEKIISDRLMELEKQLAKVENSIKIVLKRQELLNLTIGRSEVLPSLTNLGEDEPEEEVKHKKGKKKKINVGNGTKDDRPCGWDKRLIVDDHLVEGLNLEEIKLELHTDEDVKEEVDGQDTPAQVDIADNVCMRGRRRCDRHQGWQKTIAVQLEFELTFLERSQKSLQEYIEELKSSNENKSISDEIRNGFLERKGLLNV